MASQSSLPETVQALIIREDRESLDLVDVPFASRKDVMDIPAGSVLLKVKSIALNPVDWKLAFSPMGTTGGVLGGDASGDIVATGPGVEHLQVGDRAAGFTIGHGFLDRPGSFSEYVLLSASGTFKIPEGISYQEGASLPISLITAVQCLYMRHHLALPSSPSTENTPILIWGGSTGVGHYAIQLAKLSGYKVFATASPAVFEEIKALGAAEVFDYKDPDTPRKIREAAGPNGITMGVDTVSDPGTMELTAASLSLTSKSNKMVAIRKVLDGISFPSNTTAEDTLAYTVLGLPFRAYHKTDYPIFPDDVSAALEFVSHELPLLFSEGKLKIHKLKLMSGGLGGVVDGLKIMKAGNYGREKLVYDI